LNIDRIQKDTEYSEMLNDSYKKIDEDEKKEQEEIELPAGLDKALAEKIL